MGGDQSSDPIRGITARDPVPDPRLELTVVGDLDMATAMELETRFDARVRSGGVNAVEMDLAQVGFIDSAGVGALVAIRERAQQLGIEFKVTHQSDPVRRVLYVTGLGDIAED